MTGYHTDEAPTMADIARALGVSHPTVSAALRGPRGRTTTKTSPATQAAVIAKAAELGYEPPPFRHRDRW